MIKERAKSRSRSIDEAQTYSLKAGRKVYLIIKAWSPKPPETVNNRPYISVELQSKNTQRA